MTTLTPQEVVYTWEAQVYTFAEWLDLPVLNVRASADMDRVPYCMVTLTLGGVSDEVWAALDPRPFPGFAQLRLQVVCSDLDGTPLSWLGQRAGDASPTTATLFLRTARRDRVTGTVTVTAAGAESMLEDRIRLATGTIDTGATTVLGLVEWALQDTFGYSITTADPLASSTSIPAGDRRLMLPGENFNDLIETELQAISYRLYDHWGHVSAVFDREHTPATGENLNVVLATHTHAEGAPAHADPIVYEIEETMSRDGDFADGVLIKYDQTDTGGPITWQRSGDGANTKGRVLTIPRAPAGDAANPMVERTRIRGVDLTITARARFDIIPGMRLYVYTRTGAVSGSIRAVEYDTATTHMTISAQTGQPIQ